jgi:hypothetical protein
VRIQFPALPFKLKKRRCSSEQEEYVEPPEEDSTTGTVSGKPEAHIPEADLVSYIIRRGIIFLPLKKTEAEASDGFDSDSSVRFFKPVFSIIEAHLRLFSILKKSRHIGIGLLQFNPSTF